MYQVVKADNNSILNKVFINKVFSHYIKITKNNNIINLILTISLDD